MVGVTVVMGRRGRDGVGGGEEEATRGRLRRRNFAVIGFVGSEGAAAWVAAEGNLGSRRGRIGPWKRSEFPTRRPTHRSR